ncbi:helix-turn-helix transcriptional regulator [Streptomyces sp. BB1-1-1]|uniref:helix-turn-helix transcriptional regulator n=1 Tax=Streptomyces sp. BB1-1-1 TaxID=3074430 RepID=UPI002877BE26|nr:helix-turn-helix transcriptional regulator [Streptomyces sp. BB1-1-1]WND36959.1 helix-turn-helix transcriptional regulator [Streptomyces sp. BB1-1-1]
MKNSNDDGATAASFADWLRDQLTRRGYDLSGLRSGGRTAFAADSGISPATVGRMLRGDNVTDTRVLGLLAAALHVPLGEVLVRAGILDERELAYVRNPQPGERRITPEQAAAELGIEDEQTRRLFVSMTETLQRTPPPSAGEGHRAEQ